MSRANAIAVAELMLGLHDACHTLTELADITGLAIQTVRRYCTLMHKRRVLHICDWREDKRGGRTLKVYALGEGVDMPKPKPKSSVEVCARYRAKRKQRVMLQRMAANNTIFKEAA